MHLFRDITKQILTVGLSQHWTEGNIAQLQGIIFLLPSEPVNICIMMIMMMMIELLSSGPETVVLNADAVYVTSYSVLHLTMMLHRSAYFTSSEKSLPLSEVTFYSIIHSFIFSIIQSLNYSVYTPCHKKCLNTIGFIYCNFNKFVSPNSQGSAATCGGK